MRKAIIITISVIVAILLLVTFLVSPIAKMYVEKKSPEWIGRQVTMDKLHINIWGGKVRIEDFHLSEADMKTDFVTFDSLFVNLSLHKLLQKEICLDHIWLTNLDVQIVQNDTVFNFTDLLQLGTDDKEEKDTTSDGWAVGLYDIRLNGGAVTYTDVKRNSSWNLNNLKILIPGVYFSGRATDVGLALDFPDGGHLATKMNYEIATNRYNLNLDLTKLNLDMALPYVKDYLNVKTFGGTLSSNLLISGSLDDVTAMNISGLLQFDSLDVRDGEDLKILELTQSRVHIARINLFENLYNLDSVSIDGLCGSYTLFSDGTTTIDRLLVSQDSLAADMASDEKVVVEVNSDTIPAKPFGFRIGHTAVRNSCATWIDNTLYSPMVYAVSDIAIDAKEFTLNGTNDVNLQAKVQGGGSVKAHWRGGLDFTHTDQQLTLNIRNLMLKNLSPYCEYYVGSKITAGRMAFNSENVIKNGQLKGTNKVDIYNCQVTKKNKNLNVEYGNIPLKLAVSLLKDINGKIVFDVPVSGNINSPKFSYGKIVWQTISNIMLKASASPFVALARSMKKGDGLNSVPIDALQSDFTSQQYDMFSDIRDVINSSEDFKFIVQQQFNLKTTMNSQAVFQLKRDYYVNKKNLSETERLSLSDVESIKAIKDKDEDFLNYVNGIGAVGANLQEKAFAYYGRDSIRHNVMKMAEWRDKVLYYYFKQELKVPEDHLQVVTMADEDLETYTGKSQYSVEVEDFEEAADFVSDMEDSVVVKQ